MSHRYTEDEIDAMSPAAFYRFIAEIERDDEEWHLWREHQRTTENVGLLLDGVRYDEATGVARRA